MIFFLNVIVAFNKQPEIETTTTIDDDGDENVDERTNEKKQLQSVIETKTKETKETKDRNELNVHNNT